MTRHIYFGSFQFSKIHRVQSMGQQSQLNLIGAYVL